MRTTSSTGPTAARHGWTTWCCSAGAITGRCTKRASGSRSRRARRVRREEADEQKEEEAEEEEAEEEAEEEKQEGEEVEAAEEVSASTGPTGGRSRMCPRPRDYPMTRSRHWKPSTANWGSARVPRLPSPSGTEIPSTWGMRSTRCATAEPSVSPEGGTGDARLYVSFVFINTYALRGIPFAAERPGS